MLLAKPVPEVVGCWCKASHQGAPAPPAPHVLDMDNTVPGPEGKISPLSSC